MKLFRRATSEEPRIGIEHDEAVNKRLKSVLGRTTPHDDADAVERRLRNMVYGTNRQ